MTVLNSKKILEDNNGGNPKSVTTLTLTHRALSDVSCLAEFRNLERLDLGFNNLTSIECLKACVNLRWLSVAQNKLQSLKGIQGLAKLNVLNAGKNKLKSMDDVRSLLNLGALILNENEITSVCKLDQMKKLNTLVLSRNPVSEIGDSLVKTKSIRKLSLSNCQLQTTGSSLTSCTNLKELRLAHNEIKTLPVELSHNTKLRNLDLGNNLITNWSDLKVLASLVNLRNLNLQGNPIAEMDTLAKKIKKLLPKLRIFNARPIDKIMETEGHKIESFLIDGVEQVDQKEVQRNPAMGKKNSKKYLLADEEGANDPSGSAWNGARKKESSNKKQKTNDLLKEQPSNVKENHNAEKKRKKNSKLESKEDDIADNSEFPPKNPHMEKDLKRKKQKKETLSMDTASYHQKGESIITIKGDSKSKKMLKQNAGSVIDNGDTPFAEIFSTEPAENATNKNQKRDTKRVPDVDSTGGLVTIPTKNKKNKNRGTRAAIADLSPVDELGLGGPSTWDD